MIEVRGDLWTLPALARCITTNGDVTKDGLAVMGRGCALEATRFDPELQMHFGTLLQTRGNHVYFLRERPGRAALLSFPVKHHWNEAADLDLIERSANELVSVVNIWEIMVTDDRGLRDGSVLLPRPGCGNGRLTWETVEPVLAPILDDRFALVTDTQPTEDDVARAWSEAE